MISPTSVFLGMSITNLGAVLIQVGGCQGADGFLEGDARGGFLVLGLDQGFFLGRFMQKCGGEKGIAALRKQN
jgi:hypothetical protein